MFCVLRLFIILEFDDMLYYIIIYMIIDFFDRSLFLGYIRAMLIFLGPYYI